MASWTWSGKAREWDVREVRKCMREHQTAAGMQIGAATTTNAGIRGWVLCCIWFGWIRIPPEISGDFEANWPVALDAGEGGLGRGLGIEMSNCGLRRHKSRLCLASSNHVLETWWLSRGRQEGDGVRQSGPCSTIEGVSCRTSSNLTRHPRVVRAPIELGH